MIQVVAICDHNLWMASRNIAKPIPGWECLNKVTELEGIANLPSVEVLGAVEVTFKRTSGPK